MEVSGQLFLRYAVTWMGDENGGLDCFRKGGYPSGCVASSRKNSLESLTSLTAFRWIPIIFLTLGVLACHKAIKKPTQEIALANPTTLWTPRAPMLVARRNFALIPLNGKLFAIGGDDGHKKLASVEAFDPATNTWTPRHPLLTARTMPYACVFSSTIYVIGGYGPSYIPSRQDTEERSVESYDPVADSWTARAQIPSGTRANKCGDLNGRLYMFGGWEYEAIENAWSKSRSRIELSTGYFPSAFLHRRAYFVNFGSYGNDILNREHLTKVWDPEENLGAYIAPSPYLSDGIMASDSDHMYLVGSWRDGEEDNPSPVFVFDAATGQWTSRSPLPHPRSREGVAALNGILYVAGGALKQGLPTNTVEAYDVFHDDADSCSLEDDSDQSKVFGQWIPDELRRILQSPPRNPTNDFALIIGIEKYQDLPTARFAEHDAEAVRQAMEGILRVPSQNIVYLTGQRADKTEIEKYVAEWLPRNVPEGSRLYVYFSGLGMTDPLTGEPRLLPWDADTRFLKTSSYSLPALYDALKTTKAEEIVVVMDTCFADTGERCVSAKGIRSLVTYGYPKLTDPRMTAWYGAGPREAAGSLPDQHHGLFSYYFLNGLTGAAGASVEQGLSFAQLEAYVEKWVPAIAAIQSREQHPSLNSMDESKRLERTP